MSIDPQQQRVTILGAGVIGLTTALTLARQPSPPSITILAKHMPGDWAADYASPWAGANFLPLAAEGSLEQALEADTWPIFSELAKSKPEAGVHFQQAKLFSRKKDEAAAGKGAAVGKLYGTRSSADPWWKGLFGDFRALREDELRPGYDSGTGFTSIVLNPAVYLPWLVGECLKLGVAIQRGVVEHIKEVTHHSGETPHVIVNATGLGAKTLKGVEDKAMIPGRGQIVIVRNDPGVLTSTSGTDHGPEESCYVMFRPAGGGTVVGGCYQKGNWDGNVDDDLAVRIMTRAVELVPKLTDGKGIEALSVVRHAVGLRPVREGGTRIERETVEGMDVVHCYGHGGYGYQASWGSAKKAVELVGEALGKAKA